MSHWITKKKQIYHNIFIRLDHFESVDWRWIRRREDSLWVWDRNRCRRGYIGIDGERLRIGKKRRRRRLVAANRFNLIDWVVAVVVGKKKPYAQRAPQLSALSSWRVLPADRSASPCRLQSSASPQHRPLDDFRRSASRLRPATPGHSAANYGPWPAGRLAVAAGWPTVATHSSCC